jgi:hypothetical protein
MSAEQRVTTSLTGEVKNDIKAARKLWLPWWSVLTWMAFCLPVIWLCDHIGRLGMSLPLLNCIGVFGFVVYLKRQFTGEPWFWTVILLLAVLQGLLIWSILWTSEWVPALAIAVISTVDFCFMLWIVAAVERLFRGSQSDAVL